VVGRIIDTILSLFPYEIYASQAWKRYKPTGSEGYGHGEKDLPHNEWFSQNGRKRYLRFMMAAEENKSEV
jgi:hypothetical protein